MAIKIIILMMMTEISLIKMMMMIEISLIMMNDDDRNKPYYFIE